MNHMASDPTLCFVERMPLLVVMSPDLHEGSNKVTSGLQFRSSTKWLVVDSKLKSHHTIVESVPDALKGPPNTCESSQNRGGKMSL